MQSINAFRFLVIQENVNVFFIYNTNMWKRPKKQMQILTIKTEINSDAIFWIDGIAPSVPQTSASYHAQRRFLQII